MQGDRPFQSFPGTFSIKAVGHDRDNFAEFAAGLVRELVGQPEVVSYSTRPSSKGAYLSVTISFPAESQQQLDTVFEQMSAQQRVLWVL